MMWDFSGGRRSPQPPNHLPSPAFPSPYPHPPHISASYVPSSPYPPVPMHAHSSHSDSYDPYSIPRSAPFPVTAPYPPPQQTVHVIHHSKHHSSKHPSHHRHRAHSHSGPSAPIPIQSAPQVPIYNSASYPKPAIVHHSSAQQLSSRQRPSHSQNQNHVSFQAPTSSKKHSSGHAVAVPQILDHHFQYSKCTGRRKALCIGINYRGQSNELRGCVNDAKRVRDFLIQRGRYRSEDIIMLTDDTKDPRQLPTRQNIIVAMKWLVRSARTNDSLFFHYSGHGGQTPDKDGDEVDGWDEVIFPLDFKKNGHILDDEMHDIMVKPLAAGCRLTGLFDACHSGTVLDLPYIYSSHGRLKGSHVSNRARARKSTPADVISWSGCKDGQTSADTFSGGVAVGAMSHAFITALMTKPNQTYQELLRSIRLILYPRFSQKPQLGSSHHIDTGLGFIF